jgi:integrase
MSLRLRGNAWYLKKTIKVGGVSKVREFPLKVFGGEAARKKAEAAAKTLEQTINKASAAADVMAEFGIRQAPDEKRVPTLRAWWESVQNFYGEELHPKVEHWLTFTFGLTSTWGATPIDQFKKSDCLKALTTRRQQHRRGRAGRPMKNLVTEATVQKERGIMQAIFQRGVDDELIDSNPWKGIAKPSGPVGRRNEDGTFRLLEEGDDERKFMAELTPRLARAARVFLLTGIRLEGLIGLRPERIRKMRDGHVYAHVAEKSVDHNTACPICGRVGKKCREVPMTTEAEQVVKDQLAADGELWGGADPAAMAPRELRRLSSSMEYQFAQAAERAGICRISPHDLRFTFGHRYLVAGGRLQDLSRLLGHSSITITEKHYAYRKPSDLAAEMERVMGGGTKPTKPTRGGNLKLVSAST